ncbi:GAF domain-containing protein [Acetobacter sp. AN02]|uniref:helix-turn-helix domain-containing protein n=1 Tax=Acetobacter sp. AN02 TaxID=2894186 RepID=UPI0024344124|nr:helix-turn-helix domain-containing protein [Acetobacter sp. AN02]MDG6094131.1 GAF domain-containing protein [Acetobacter sp. AN02]
MASGPVSNDQLAAIPQRLRSSWLRCADAYGIDSGGRMLEELLCPAELRQVREQMGSMMKATDPELDRLHGIVSNLDYTVLLANPDGIIVSRRGDAPFEKGCRRWHLWPGARWGEDLVGTNGVGTSLREERPVTVHMDHHWRLNLRYLTCTAVPFYGPDGKVAGTLDASSTRPDPTGRVGTMMEAVLIDAARRLERRSFLEAFHNRTVVMLGDGDDISLPMVALDESRVIVGATQAARKKLNLPEGDTSGVSFDLSAQAAGIPDFREAERSVIEGALAMSQGKITPAARLLGISRSTLHRKIKAMSATSPEEPQ